MDTENLVTIKYDDRGRKLPESMGIDEKLDEILLSLRAITDAISALGNTPQGQMMSNMMGIKL